VQCVLIGGPYTTASQVRQCQLVCPAAAVAEARNMPNEDLVGAERVPVRQRVGGWVIHFPAVVFTVFPQQRLRLRRGAGTWNGGCPFMSLHPHREEVPVQTRNVVGRLKVAAPVSKTDATSRGIRRQRFCMPPIGIVTAPPMRTWRTW
jgi:hypothetical protein